MARMRAALFILIPLIGFQCANGRGGVLPSLTARIQFSFFIFINIKCLFNRG